MGIVWIVRPRGLLIANNLIWVYHHFFLRREEYNAMYRLDVVVNRILFSESDPIEDGFCGLEAYIIPTFNLRCVDSGNQFIRRFDGTSREDSL